LLHFTTLHPNTLRYTSPNSPNYTSLHFITLHPTTLRYTSPHFIQLHFTTLHPNTLRYTSPNLPNYTSLHFTTLHPTTLRYTSPHFIQLHFTTLRYISPHFTQLHFTTLSHTSPNYTPLHLSTLHSLTFTLHCPLTCLDPFTFPPALFLLSFSCQIFNESLNFLDRCWKNYQISDFMRICHPVRADLLHIGRQDTEDLVASFRNVAKAPKISGPN